MLPFQAEVEQEFWEILRAAEETKQVWETKNYDRFAWIVATAPRPGYAAVRGKLQDRRARRDAKNQ